MQQFAAREIGERIAQARRENSAMTQEELADALNVSTRALQDYEAGKRIPWKHFSRLEQIFKRDLDWFLHGQAEEEPAEPALLARLEEIERQLGALDRKLDLLDPSPRLGAIEAHLAEISRAASAARA